MLFDTMECVCPGIYNIYTCVYIGTKSLTCISRVNLFGAHSTYKKTYIRAHHCCLYKVKSKHTHILTLGQINYLSFFFTILIVPKVFVCRVYTKGFVIALR